MKKFLALLILLALIPVAIIVPDRARDSKRIYEQRMVASLNAVKGSVRSLAGGSTMDLGIFAPNVNSRGQGNGLMITGILMSWPPITGRDRYQRFTAELYNACEEDLAPDCLGVDKLAIGDTTLIDGGSFVDALP